jgi:hypothetical protein
VRGGRCYVDTMADEFIECAVCGRNLLRGERVTEYATPEREVVKVCELCRPAAEASGWIPAHLAATMAEPARARRRGLGMRERLSRASAAAREMATRPPRSERGRPEPDRARPAPNRRREREGRQAAADKPSPARRQGGGPDTTDRTPDRVMRRALERFNAAREKRVVAGLIRSLGEPRVTVRVAEGASAVVTVAWELSWYQWEISANGDGAVREAGKGSEVSELPEHDRAWNASAKPDGTLRLQSAKRRGESAG